MVSWTVKPIVDSARERSSEIHTVKMGVTRVFVVYFMS